MRLLLDPAERVQHHHGDLDVAAGLLFRHALDLPDHVTPGSFRNPVSSGVPGRIIWSLSEREHPLAKVGQPRVDAAGASSHHARSSIGQGADVTLLA